MCDCTCKNESKFTEALAAQTRALDTANATLAEANVRLGALVEASRAQADVSAAATSAMSVSAAKGRRKVRRHG